MTGLSRVLANTVSNLSRSATIQPARSYSMGINHERVKKIQQFVTQQLVQMPVCLQASNELAKSQKKAIIDPFISTNEAAQHVLDLYDKAGISRSDQTHCFTAHAATRLGSIESLLSMASLYSQHGYQWLGMTPSVNSDPEAHVYHLRVGDESAIAAALTFKPENLTPEDRQELIDSNQPVIQDIFLSALIDPPSEIDFALRQIPTPLAPADLYTPLKLPDHIVSTLSKHHYTRSICHISQTIGLGGYNHLSERHQDIPDLADMSLDEQFKWVAHSLPENISINNHPNKE